MNRNRSRDGFEVLTTSFIIIYQAIRMLRF